MIKIAYVITWREQGSYIVRRGLKRYLSLDDAQKQVEKWSKEFPRNRYDIELDVNAVLY